VGKIEVEDRSGGERSLEAGEIDLLHSAATAARNFLGEHCLAVGICVVMQPPGAPGVSTAMYVTYPDRLEPESDKLRDAIASTVAIWDRKQKAGREG
jgi:hypothetical protein